MNDLNKIGEDLFNKIRGRFPNVTIGNENGEVISEPAEARFFNFKYESHDEELAEISISIDTKEGLTVFYSKDFLLNKEHTVKQEWYDFLKELRQFAKRRLLKFDVRDITKSNLNKKDFEYLAKSSGESKMNETTMYGTNKTSYQRIGNARLAIKHSEPINVESSTGRTHKIANIFIESPDGERFRYPYRHLSGARAMARHVSEGGTAYDDFGKYISSLSEELSKLKKFNTYMNRNGVMAETLSEYTDIVKERTNSIRKEIQNLQKENYYKQVIEHFSPPIVEEVPGDVAENWIDQLTIRQFNEELKDVFPYIYRLVGEAKKVKQLGPEDLDETDKVENDPCWKGYKMVGTKKKNGKQVPNCVPESENIDESDIYSDLDYVNIWTRQGEEALANALGLDMNEFEQLVQQELKKPKKYQDDKTEEDRRDSAISALIVKQNMTGGYTGVAEYSDQETTEDQNRIHSQKGNSGSLITVDEYETATGEKSYVVTAEINTNKFSQTFADASEAEEWFKNALSLDEPKEVYLFFKHRQYPSKENNQDEITDKKTPIGEFILSYFDRETGKFPKGETAVLTAVEKDYGDQYVEPSRKFIEQLQAITLEYNQKQEQQSRYPETDAIKRLAGL